MQNQYQNPYAPPEAWSMAPQYGGYGGSWGGDMAMLASRGARFGARMIDGLLMLAAIAPGMIWLFMAIDEQESARHASYASSSYGSPSYSSSHSDPMAVMIGPILLMVVMALGLSIFQWIRIAKRGQTLGKGWLGIKVVKLDGSPVDFVSGVIMREWVQSLINNLPWVGGIIALVDACMIFSQDQMCMHDKIAKTKVIVAGTEGQPGYPNY